MSRQAPAAISATTAFVKSAAPREFPFSDREFEKIARKLYAEAGIDMPRSKEPLVYSRLAKRIRALGLDSFADYVKLIEEPGTDEIEHMLVALTTNVTRFYREPHHFADLKSRLMPALAERARRRGRVRMWSAGCSSGQEPYSMAMTVLDAMPDAGSFDVKILATDINTQVVREARLGAYQREALNGAPQPLVERYFSRPEPGILQAGDELKRLIAFRTLNLMGDWPMKGTFDVVFCRNVTIYFDEETQARLWKRIADKIAPGGRLYIGHSERVSGPALDILFTDGVTAYTKVGP
ncbi:MAG: protein-glutamate O-methyltransferase CheR [Rhodobacteraceae bacterium]|nr:MAG: protein-glutamate O-methyltransferase CheR [Paracoccaceae bacterium]